jgi:beta-phosphoglucomutase-like phosphatase (HAD superfamily)
MSNKLVIFDLDGVLIDSKDLHYKALNYALEEIDYKYIISYQEHLSRYDGLNTRKKLSMLTKEKGLPQESHETVWQLKQEQTFKMLENLSVNNNAINIMLYLKSKGVC